MWQSAQDSYLESRVLSADPVELIRLLYGAATASVREARRHLAAGAIAERSRAITKACQVLAELAVSLDYERGGEIARRLAQLYDYMGRQLIEANVRQMDAPLEEVLNLLGTLSEGWDGIQAGAAVESAEPENVAEPEKVAVPESAWAQPGQSVDSPWSQPVESADSPWGQPVANSDRAWAQPMEPADSPLAQPVEHFENPLAQLAERVENPWAEANPWAAANPRAEASERPSNPWAQAVERADSPWAQPSESSEDVWAQPLPPEAADTYASRAWNF